MTTPEGLYPFDLERALAGEEVVFEGLGKMVFLCWGFFCVQS